MIRGLYTAGTGMITQSKRMDVITNNLANVNTNGFKEDNLVSRSFEEVLIERINDPSIVNTTKQVGPLTLGVHIDQVFTRFEQGSMQQTGNQTDFAIRGEGFFVVQTDDGEFYTRDGAFEIDDAGRLTTKEGNPVLGRNGQINIGSNKFSVNSNGEVFVNGAFVDSLRVVSFENNDDLRKSGSNLYMNFNPQNAEVESDGTIAQGYLEGANVDLVKGMVEMIEVYRNYETNQRVVKMLDETLAKAVNDIARI